MPSARIPLQALEATVIRHALPEHGGEVDASREPVGLAVHRDLAEELGEGSGRGRVVGLKQHVSHVAEHAMETKAHKGGTGERGGEAGERRGRGREVVPERRPE